MPHWSDSDSATISRLHRAGALAVRALPGARVRAGLLRRWRTALHRGERVECPLCGGRFRHFMSDWNRAGAKCWRCGAHERHRGLWLHLQRHPELLEGVGSLLHVAPEWCLERRLRELVGPGYVTSSFEPGEADLTLDLRAIDLPDASLDAVLASHILEHIDDDAAAMRELHRVVRPGGWAIVMVPVDRAATHTLEDPSIQGREERARAYWQEDHLRLYALDVMDRLAAAGFEVERARPALEAGPDLAAYHGLHDDDVFVCRRRS